MNKFPFEIWSRIFSLACFNDIQTGYFLILTCKPINRIASEVRFNTTSVFGGEEIVGLASVLKRLPPHRRVVQNLLVSRYGLSSELAEYKKAMIRHEIDARKKGLVLRRSRFNYSGGAPKVKLAATDTAVAESLQVILSTVSGTIETLTVCHFRTNLPSINYTCLRDLTVVDGPSLLPIIPSLRRLHIAGLKNGEELKLVTHTPALEQLRLTGTSREPGCYAHPFFSALTSESNSALPQSIRRVIIQLLDPEPLPRSADEKICKAFTNGIFLPSGEAGLVLLEDRSLSEWSLGGIDTIRYCTMDAMTDWLDILQRGGEGCWSRT